MLRHEPHAVGQEREVDQAIVVELHVVRVIPGLAQAILVPPHDALVDGVLAGVDIRLGGDDLGHLVLVGQRRIDPLARFHDGRHHRAAGVRVFLREFQRRAQYLFGMVAPDVLRGGRGDADAIHDRAVAPWLADAEAIHIPDAHIGHHLRRRHGNDLGLLHRIDAIGGEPVIQPHRVGAGGERLREGVVAFFGTHQLGQGRPIDRALARQLLRQRDGLAIVVQAHQHGHVLLLAADPHLHAVQQAVQHVGGIEVAIGQFVAHAGPRRFLAEHEFDAIFLVEAQYRRHHDRCAVGQRDEADPDLRFLGRVRSGGPGATGCQAKHAPGCRQACAMDDAPAGNIDLGDIGWRGVRRLKRLVFHRKSHK